ncbi:MAG: 50S ribosomal protein L16 [Patescibacteria group bacterium]|nr:50S ribosomal protein L16 [Patescibacteria group bacterium]MDE1945826.1 50S ribosomal protein L16 [Patescibacteria group bacterium]
MLVPKKVKFRKAHTFRENADKIGVETRGTKVSFGSFGLKSLSAGRIKSNQIESARKAIAHTMPKSGKIWTRIFPDHPYTQKPAEVKMGKGKGELEGYVAIVKPGRVLFEVDGVDETLAREILRKGGTKLPVDTKVIARF